MRFHPQSFLITAALAASSALAQTAPQPTTPVKRMAADAHPSFAVATIKPSDPDSNRQGFNAVGDRFTIRNQTLISLIMYAYSMHPRQIVDGPDWSGSARYDIDGKTDIDGEPSLRQQQEMLQKLLVDRFRLKFHREQRELSVYAIRIAKGGPKLKPAADPDAEPDQEASVHGTDLTVTITSASLADFILGMQFFIKDRPLVDQTGLTGRYDFKLRYTYDEAATTDPNAPPGLFTAAQEQLGLKLEPVKTAADVFAIDHVERPSGN